MKLQGGKEICERDAVIIRLVSEGCSNREIARNLFLAPSTIANSISRLMRIFGAVNRVHLVMRAQQNGLFTRN